MQNRARILVVDDEKDVRTIIRASLEPDYEVFEAQDGLEALERINRIEPDLIILDVMMPLMNGFETCESIRKNPAFIKTPVMFLSALTDKEQIKKGYGAGGNLYLTKPFEPDRLKRNIEHFFQQSPGFVRRKNFTREQILDFEKSVPAPVSPPTLTPKDMIKPVAPQPAPQSAPQHAAPAYQMKSKTRKEIPRVMVVDDDENIFDYIMLTIKDEYEVVWAKDGFAAIEKMVIYEPDILLLDIMIPKVSGFQLCHSIRKNNVFGSMPIIMISARSEKKDIDYGYRMGANAYVVKPFEPQELLDVLTHFSSLPTFHIKTKKVPFAKIMEIEAKDMEKMEADDAKFVRKVDESEKHQKKENHPPEEEKE